MVKKTTGKLPKKIKVEEGKEQSNSASTGGAGPFFEMHVQANFVVLMLTGGYVPYMRLWPIKEIKLQSKIYGYETDDVTVTVESSVNGEKHILFGSIKRSVDFVVSNKAFSDVIVSTWRDFNTPNLFTRGKDKLAMIIRTISSSDYDDLKWLSAQANAAQHSDDFFTRVETPKFSSESKRKMVLVFQKQLEKANNGIPISPDDLYQFFKHFIVLAYDLGDRGGIVLSLLHSHISQFNKTIPGEIWSRIVEFTQLYNQDAGVITIDKVPQDIRDYFGRQEIISFPIALATLPQAASKPLRFDKDIALISLIGGWDEKNNEDIAVIEKLTGEAFPEWIKRIKDRYLKDEIPLEQTGGQWAVIEKGSLWPQSGKFLFDEDLKNLQEVAVSVFQSPDPKFDLKEENQPMARVLGHNTRHSYSLRKGLSDSLAIIKRDSEHLVNVSKQRRKRCF